MAKKKPAFEGAAADLVEADGVLADFAKPLYRPRTKRSENVDAGLRRMAGSIGRLKASAVVQLTLSGDRKRHRCVGITPEGAEVSGYGVENPDLEIRTSKRVWEQIADGELSPLEAYVRGQLRVRGDIALAQRLARRLQKAPRSSRSQKKA